MWGGHLAASLGLSGLNDLASVGRPNFALPNTDCV